MGNTKKSKIFVDHFEIASEENPVPIEPLRFDMHSKAALKAISAVEGNLVFLGTHLCNRLSSRLVDLFSRESGAKVLILAPCCIPCKSRRPVELNGNSLTPLELHYLEKPYETWVNFLYDGVQVPDTNKRILKADLTKRSHGKSIKDLGVRNKFILACK